MPGRSNTSDAVRAPTRDVRVAVIAVIGCGLALALLQRGLFVAVGDRSTDFGALVRFDAGLWLLWLVLSPAVVFAARRWPFHGDLSRSMVAHLLSAIALSAIHTVALIVGLQLAIGGADGSRSQVTAGLLIWRLAIDAFVYATILAIIVALDAAARARTQEIAATRAEEESARARLNALQMQIQPHFLFNTLNTAAMLARAGDGAAAAEVITQLSSLLRELVADAPDVRVSLRAELAFVERYLAIERVRFGERLRVRIDATPDSLDVVVPRLLLQPIVENAVRHGLSRSPTSGEISIAAATTSGQWLTVSVADDGPGLPQATDGVIEGIGLRNTRSRLAALYGDAFELGLSGAPGRVVATLRLPISVAPA